MSGLPVNRVLRGNCLDVMRGFPEESVDMVMTSPPYWGLRNYGELTEVDWGDWKGQLGLEPTWQMYVEHMVSICRQIKRVLKRTGSMYLVLGDTYAASRSYQVPQTKWKSAEPQIVKNSRKTKGYQPKCLMGMPWRVAFALIDDGWILRERIVWHKDNPMPGSQKDRLTQTCELIFHFVKNTGKALLWRNELTDEWIHKKPKQVYYHVETRELRDKRPPKEERYVVDEFGNRHLVWKPLWRGFDYYYELDAIREPHKTSSINRAGKSGTVPFNLRVRDVKRGKNGLFVEGGKVKQLKASEKEVENYVYPEKPFQAKKKPYVENNPHRMRLQKQKFLALDPSRPMDLSHPKGKNPGDVVRVQPEGHGHDRLGSRGPGLRPWEERFHPKGKNPGDVLKLNSVASPSGPQRWEREGTNRVEARFHPDGKNPGDFWSICTKPFKGAHFAVYPEAICVRPVKSSCPPDGVVLDPMCGSGTTLVTAKKLGRKWVGIDVNSAYVDMARKRVSAVSERLDAFVGFEPTR